MLESLFHPLRLLPCLESLPLNPAVPVPESIDRWKLGILLAVVLHRAHRDVELLRNFAKRQPLLHAIPFREFEGKIVQQLRIHDLDEFVAGAAETAVTK